MKTGLFFGSFNPIHIGHLIIANYMAENTTLDEVWFVVSPQNPFKNKKTLARDHDRLHLVRIAIDDNPKLKASNIEFDLPKPSYTVDTLINLKEKFPQRAFALIMGGDNLSTFHKWKNYKVILENYPIHVYNRIEQDKGIFENGHPSVHFHDAPMLNISASYIRNCIKGKKSIRYMVHDTVFNYIDGSNMYQ